MERLTRKSLEYKDTWIADGSLSNIEGVVRGRAIDRLAEFEDLMEANKFESIEELQNALNGKFENIFDEKHKIWIKVVEDKTYVEKRNRILEERWEKLKALLEEDMEHNSKEYDESLCSAFQHYSATENWVLDRMQELEKED